MNAAWWRSRREMIRRAIKGMILIAALAVAVSASAATGRPATAGPSPTPWIPGLASATPQISPTPTTAPTASPTPSGVQFPIAVIARYDDTRPSISVQALTDAASTGHLIVPCEVNRIDLNGRPLALSTATMCLPAVEIETRIHATANALALLPPGLVSPTVKVLPIGEADLFGSPSHRSRSYPLEAATASAEDWTAYAAGEVRTLISTGDTCPDRGVSHQAVVAGKGWDWTLSGGTAHYVGFHNSSWNWPVPDIVRDADVDTIAALVSDSDVSANDFECAMLSDWQQHDTGMIFSIDPAVAALLAGKGGVKVVTLGSNHITDYGIPGVQQTLRYLDAAGIKHTGAGLNLSEALSPAVVDVRGIRFAFVGWDNGSDPDAATATQPGYAQWTDEDVCKSIKEARAVADIVIAMPQWGSPEYHNDITRRQLGQRQLIYDCGANGILGSGTHWASWASITPGTSGPVFAIGSHGNFLFDQNWSRQTMEGVVVEATFYGKRLVQFRLHPYVVVDDAQPNLLDPTTDGAYVLNQVWSVSDVR